MSEQEIFEFLRNNLQIRLKTHEYFQPRSDSISFELWMVNPQTGTEEMISQSDSFSLDS